MNLRTKKKTVLPFPKNPPVRAYLHHAYASGILSNRSASYRHFYNYYIQIQSSRNGLSHDSKQDFTDFYPHLDCQTFEALGVTSVSPWSGASEGKLEAEKFVAELSAALARGNYLEVTLDEFYLPCSWAFKKCHFRHQHLLVGYDEGVFYGVGYRRDLSFGAATIPADLVYRAVYSVPAAAKGYAASPQIREIRLNEDHESELDLGLIAGQLEDFVQARNTARSYFGFPYMSDMPGAVFGYRAYGRIRENLENRIARGETIDLRTTRLIWERASLMLERLEQIGRQRKCGFGRKFVTQWGTLATCYRAMHISAFQYNRELSQGQAQGHYDLGRRFEQLAEDEMVLTRHLISELN